MLALQRAAGNAAVARELARSRAGGRGSAAIARMIKDVPPIQEGDRIVRHGDGAVFVVVRRSGDKLFVKPVSEGAASQSSAPSTPSAAPEPSASAPAPEPSADTTSPPPQPPTGQPPGLASRGEPAQMPPQPPSGQPPGSTSTSRSGGAAPARAGAPGAVSFTDLIKRNARQEERLKEEPSERPAEAGPGSADEGLIPVMLSSTVWGREGDEDDAARYRRERGAGAPEPLTFTVTYPTGPVFPPGTFADYDWKWWFNYLWNEVPDGPQKEAIHKWIEPFTLDADVRRQAPPGLREQMDKMLELGFIRMDESALMSPSAAYEGPQGENTEYHKIPLPSLREAGLVYRSDSRSPEAIKAHGGSKPRSRVPTLAADVGMDEPWNPWQDRSKRDALWLRRRRVDNDLQTVVSLAVDPREAVKFPLPGQIKGPGDRLVGETDQAHLYVIRAGRVLNTTGIMSDQLRAAPFGRGELGGVDVPFETHLVHVVVDRFFAEGNVEYVAGRVHAVELIQDEEVYLRLPAATRKGLYEVVRALNGGDLRWLVHGVPNDEVMEHRRIGDFLEGRGGGGPKETPGAGVHRPALEHAAMERDPGLEMRLRRLEVRGDIAPRFAGAREEAAALIGSLEGQDLMREPVVLLRSLVAEADRLGELYVEAEVTPPAHREAFIRGLDGYRGELGRLRRRGRPETALESGGAGLDELDDQALTIAERLLPILEQESRRLGDPTGAATRQAT